MSIPQEPRLKLQQLFCEKFQYILPHRHGYFVSGGVFPRLYHGLPIRDIDVFAETPAIHQELLDDWFYFNTDFDFLEGDSTDYVKRFIHKATNIKIEVIQQAGENYVNSTNFISRFDFSLARIRAVYYSANRDSPFFVTAPISSTDLEDIHNKKLRFTGKLLFGSSHNNTINRLLKYVKLGFQISEEDYAQLASGIYELIYQGVAGGAIEGQQIGAVDGYQTPAVNAMERPTNMGTY